MKKLFTVVFSLQIAIYTFGQCNPPSTPYVTSATGSSANIGWIAGTGTAWQVQYGISPGFTLGSGTTVNVTSNTPTLNGLAGSSNYVYYVRTDCGNGTFSTWAGPVPFSTLCSGPQNAPVFYDFEDTQWNPPTTFNTPGTIGNCWIMLASDPVLDWTTGPPFFPNNFTGPDVDHTTGTATGQYIHMDNFGFTNAAGNVRMRMPEVSLTPLTSPELSYWYHMFGNGIDKMLVQIKKRGGNWVTLKTYTGEQQTSRTDAWKQEIISLSAYANDTVFVRFRGYKNAGFTQNIEMAIDDIRIAEAPNCPQPSALAVVSETNNSVTLSWTSGGAANAQIEYGPQGFTQGNGTIVNVGTSPATVNNLTANTAYTFYVRDSCNATDKSYWVGPISARTDCNPITAPYTENFNGNAWTIGSNFNTAGTINNCWSRNNSADYYWDPGPPIFANFLSGPDAGKGGSGKYLYARRQNFFSPVNAIVETPLIDLSSLTTPELAFWYHMYGTDITSLEVEIDSGNGFNSLQLLSGQSQSAKTDPWLESVINLAAYSGKTVKLRFTGIGGANNGNRDQIAIDDLSIKEAPTCPKPSGLNVTFVGFDKATVGWTTGGASNWIVRYRTTPSGAWQSVATSTNPATITGLSANTEYEVQVRDSCGANDLSVWTTSETFTTNCAPVVAPYSEDFNGSTFVPSTNFGQAGSINSCWSRDATTGYYWDTGDPPFVSNFTGPSGDYPNGTGNYLTTLTSGGFGSGNIAEILTPLIDLSNVVSPELSFWYHMFGNNITSLKVEINNGSGWTQVNSITGQQQTAQTDAWLERIVSLSSYGGDTVQLKFIGERSANGFSSQISIDNISLYELPTCPKPSALQFNSALATSANLSWTSGGANNWVYKYKTSSGTALSYGASSVNSNFNLTGLTANTEYEFWVRDSCGTGDVSLWVGPLVFRTECNVTGLPFSENFDGTSWVPAANFNDDGDINSCWIRETNEFQWIPKQGASFFFGTGPSADNTSGTGNYVMTNPVGFGAADTDSELETPWIDLGGTVQPELEYYYHMFGNQIDKLEVLVKKIDGTSVLLNTTTGAQQTAKTSPWLLQNINLSAYTGDTIKVVFKGYRISGGFNSNIAIDDVEIEDAVCAPPTNLFSSAVTSTSIDVSWNSTGGNSNLQYGLSGFTLGQGTYIANVNSVYTIPALTPFTTYDIYVKDSCGAANVSAWVGPISVTTTCDPANASFNLTASNLTVTFNSTASTGTNITYNWAFGDGNTSVLPNPTHTYAASGSYTVQLIVTDTCGLSDTITQGIQVCDPPVAIINYSINNLTVDFDGTASIGAVSYFWDLGNGIFNTSATPSFTYAAQGSYNVSLIVTNDCGDTDTAFATVVICDEPTSFFTYKIIQSNGSGMLVDFDGTLSNGQTSFLWQFGDGATNTTSLTPSHTYTVPGLFYEVALITFSQCGTSDTMKYALGDVVSIDEWAYGEVKVFPNPAEVVVRVAMNEITNDMQFIWFDISGKFVEAPMVDVTLTKAEFDVSALKPGQYILLIQGERGQKAVRVIIQ